MPEQFYQPIDVGRAYDRDDFVRQFGKLNDLEKAVLNLQKDPTNPKALSDIGGITHQDPGFYLSQPNAAEAARVGADRALSQGLSEMTMYVDKNIERFLDLIGENEVEELLSKLPLYKTGDEEHDKFVDSVNEIRKIEDASKDPAKMHSYVRSKIDKAPKWLREEMSLLDGSQAYVSALFSAYAVDVHSRFKRAIRNEKGEFDAEKVKARLIGSLHSAKREYENAYEADKEYVWDEYVEPYLATIARAVYPKEKKANRSDEKKESDKRKSEIAERLAA